MKLITLLLLFVTCNLFAFEATVYEVKDGDTIKVKNRWNKNRTIRLWGIDAPESYFLGKNQGHHATDAKEYLVELLPKGSEVTIEYGPQFNTSDYRIIGRVLINGKDVSLELLRKGLVVPYILFPYDIDHAELYMEAGSQAADQNLGIFSIKDPLTEMPYQFRTRVRNWTPGNYIGDYQTKLFYDPGQYELIPVWRRVFFKEWWDATDAGFFYSGDQR